MKMTGLGQNQQCSVRAEHFCLAPRPDIPGRAQTADGLRADLVGLGVRLGWVAADEKEEPAVVRERLRHEGEGILLIYDKRSTPRGSSPTCRPWCGCW